MRVMEFYPLCKGVIIGVLLVGSTEMGRASSKAIIESVRAMEREHGVTITWHYDLARGIRHSQQVADHHVLFGPAISPDGVALAWSSYPIPYLGEKIPFLTVESLKEGIQTVWVEGRIAASSGVSSGADVIVSIAPAPLQSGQWELLAIDRHAGIVVHDLTRFLTQFELGNNVESISVSGPGTLAALGAREQMQVLEIPNGKTVYSGAGRFPRLSPDGKRLAFVDSDKLLIHSFMDRSTVQLLKGKRVKGVGGWSPDGRFLLVGAWSTLVALEKRQIIVDTTTGEYAVIGKLGEGDYGSNFGWVSIKLLKR